MTDLPPLDDDIAYVVVAENDQRGPYQLEVLITEVLAGRIYDSTPIWWPGLPEWTTIAAHPGIAAELQRRRDAYAAASGAAVPQPSPMGPPPAGPSPAPTLGMFGQSVAGAAAPADQTQAPVYSNPGQDYSTDLYAGSGVAAPVSPVLEPQPGAAVPADPQFQQVPPGQQVPAQVAGGL
ncbi:MAG: GYF domain-containing protein, partial [Actinomycetes bacterium]